MPELGSSSSVTALVDLNVWLALVYDGHMHHLAAVSWFVKVIAGALPFAELLAGFAIAAQVSFVTFDRGFSRYGQLSLTLLSGSVA